MVDVSLTSRKFFGTQQPIDLIVLGMTRKTKMVTQILLEQAACSLMGVLHAYLCKRFGCVEREASSQPIRNPNLFTCHHLSDRGHSTMASTTSRDSNYPSAAQYTHKDPGMP
jgi:hypothetical protein